MKMGSLPLHCQNECERGTEKVCNINGCQADADEQKQAKAEGKPELRQVTLQKRILRERAELALKVEKLGKFLDEGEGLDRVDPAEQKRLSIQHGLMLQYLEVLDERIAAASFQWHWPEA